MTIDRKVHALDISRRTLLRGAGLVAGGGALISAGLAAAPAAAQATVTQTMAHYQPTPKGNARCDKCAQWKPPAACNLVQGKISPSGWCLLYAPKT